MYSFAILSLQHGQYSRTFVLSALKADPVFVSSQSVCVFSLRLECRVFSFLYQLSSVVAMVIRFGIRTGKSRRRVHDSDSGQHHTLPPSPSPSLFLFYKTVFAFPVCMYIASPLSPPPQRLLQRESSALRSFHSLSLSLGTTPPL